MPYLSQEDRYRLDKGDTPATAEELTYALTALIDTFLIANERASYNSIGLAIGALECAKLELYRRGGSSVADTAKQEHGDVYAVLTLED